MCARVSKFVTRKSAELLQNDDQACVWLQRMRRVGEQPMYVGCTSTVFIV